MERYVDSPTSQAPDPIKRVTVYASSSNALDSEYYVGLMRAMADSALAQGAHVHGVIPHFLNTVEHGHQSLSRLEVVNDMRERKHRMIADSHAVVSLPGGSGTFEEVFEVLTLKRLGLYLGPVVLINTRRYFDRFVDFLQHSVNERFMSEKHLEMWSLVDNPEQVLDAMQNAVRWSAAAREFAAVKS
jgi:uncharacterized protein (TIGR00730 family)